MLRAAVAIVLLSGCSLHWPDDAPPPEDDVPSGDCTDDPGYVAGGGASGELATQAGPMRYCVVDQYTSLPIAGAALTASDGATAVTDGDGRASFTGRLGLQDITVVAVGYVPTTWSGASGQHNTIVLDRIDPPSARARGTIAGWQALPDPRPGHHTEAIVSYSLTRDYQARENHLVQIGDANRCIRTPTVEMPCAWALTTRIGPQIHTAVILDVDDSDDTRTVIGYATGIPVVMAEGQTLTDSVLTMVRSNELVRMTAEFQPPPPDRDEVRAIPLLDIGEAGRIAFAAPGLGPDAPEQLVLSSTGTLAGTYYLAAIATPTTGPYPFTRVVEGVTEPVLVPSTTWPEPYTMTDCGTDCWQLPASETMHIATLSRAGTVLWKQVVFGMDARVMLPPDVVAEVGELDLYTTVCFPAGWATWEFSFPDLLGACDLDTGASTTVLR